MSSLPFVWVGNDIARAFIPALLRRRGLCRKAWPRPCYAIVPNFGRPRSQNRHHPGELPPNAQTSVSHVQRRGDSHAV
jgi:hypothetical protein